MAKNETFSRIVPHLSEAAGVVTSRGDVHYVVTEYGAAYLHGKSIRERAIALINIAHPQFREKLLNFAKVCCYVYADQVLPKTGKPQPITLKHHLQFTPQKTKISSLGDPVRDLLQIARMQNVTILCGK